VCYNLAAPPVVKQALAAGAKAAGWEGAAGAVFEGAAAAQAAASDVLTGKKKKGKKDGEDKKPRNVSAYNIWSMLISDVVHHNAASNPAFKVSWCATTCKQALGWDASTVGAGEMMCLPSPCLPHRCSLQRTPTRAGRRCKSVELP
jgi:hypothetical protein